LRLIVLVHARCRPLHAGRVRRGRFFRRDSLSSLNAFIHSCAPLCRTKELSCRARIAGHRARHSLLQTEQWLWLCLTDPHLEQDRHHARPRLDKLPHSTIGAVITLARGRVLTSSSGPLFGAKEFPVARSVLRAFSVPLPSHATAKTRPLGYSPSKLRGNYKILASGRPAWGGASRLGITLCGLRKPPPWSRPPDTVYGREGQDGKGEKVENPFFGPYSGTTVFLWGAIEGKMARPSSARDTRRAPKSFSGQR